MKSLQAAAGFLGADVNNLVFVQNATTGKKTNELYVFDAIMNTLTSILS